MVYLLGKELTQGIVVSGGDRQGNRFVGTKLYRQRATQLRMINPFLFLARSWIQLVFPILGASKTATLKERVKRAKVLVKRIVQRKGFFFR